VVGVAREVIESAVVEDSYFDDYDEYDEEYEEEDYL